MDSWKQCERRIEDHARIATSAAEVEAGLSSKLPWFPLRELSPHRWERIATPVVATVGSFKTGKSSLLNRLADIDFLPTDVLPTTMVLVLVRRADAPEMVAVGRESTWRLPDITAARAAIISADPSLKYIGFDSPDIAIPWDSIDTPGGNSDTAGAGRTGLYPWELADLYLATCRADTPLPATDLRQVRQLVEAMGADHVVLALTMTDLVGDREADVRRYVDQRLRTALGSHSPVVLPTSSRLSDGVRSLRRHLGIQVLQLQRARLTASLRALVAASGDVAALASSRALARVNIDQVGAAKLEARRVLLDRLLDVHQALPALAEEAVRRVVTGTADMAPAVAFHGAFTPSLHDAIAKVIVAVGETFRSRLDSHLPPAILDALAPNPNLRAVANDGSINAERDLLAGVLGGPLSIAARWGLVSTMGDDLAPAFGGLVGRTSASRGDQLRGGVVRVALAAIERELRASREDVLADLDQRAQRLTDMLASRQGIDTHAAAETRLRAMALLAELEAMPVSTAR